MVINPYKRYPIYTERTCQMYINKRRNEVSDDVFFYGTLQQDRIRCLPISSPPVTALISR